MSTAARQAVNAQQTGEVFLFLVTIDQDDLGGPIRLVNNSVTITSNGYVYTAFPFRITLPDENEENIANAKLTICAVDQSVITAIRSMSSPGTVEVSVILADSPDTIEAGPMLFTMRNVVYTVETITADLIFEDMLDIRIPGISFTPNYFPGLF